MADVDISQVSRVSVVRESADADFSQIARVAIVHETAALDVSQIARIAVVKGFVAGGQSACRVYVVVN